MDKPLEQVVEEVRAYFGRKLTDHNPRNAALAKPCHGLHILEYDPAARGQKYIWLWLKRAEVSDKRRLGRGLGALINDALTETADVTEIPLANQKQTPFNPV